MADSVRAITPRGRHRAGCRALTSGRMNAINFGCWGNWNWSLGPMKRERPSGCFVVVASQALHACFQLVHTILLFRSQWASVCPSSGGVSFLISEGRGLKKL